MKRIAKTFFSFLLRFGLSAGLLWLIFSRIDDKEQIAILINTADPWYIFYALVFFGAVHYIVLLRWRIFIKAFSLDIPWMNMSRYFFLGLFGNLFLPTAIGGDVIKTAGLCINTQEKQKVVASVLLDRLSGFASMVVISCLSLAVGFQYFKNPLIWLTVLMMGLTLTGIGVVLFHEKLYRFFCQVFYFFPKVRTAVMQMHYDIALLKDQKRVLIQAVGVSCFSQIFLAVTFFLLAKALHQDVMLFYFIIFTPIACVASSFPSIGGLGFREGALEYLLVGAGVAAGVGASIGLLSFLFMVVVGMGGGVFFFMTKDDAGGMSEDRG